MLTVLWVLQDPEKQIRPTAWLDWR
eukprot:COSAG01_NODE_53286_length_340_cov_0.863071_2_plen_24_part_01